MLDGMRTAPSAEDIVHKWEVENEWNEAGRMRAGLPASLQRGDDEGGEQDLRDPLDRLGDQNDAAIDGGMDIPAADDEDFE